MRRSVAIVAVVLGLALLFGLTVSLLAPPSADRPDPGVDREPDVYRLEGYESGFYPYLNDRPELGNRSPVNLVMRANLSEVTTALQQPAGTEWNVTEPAPGEDEVAPRDASGLNVTGTNISWDPARGSARYGYVHNGSSGEWVRESAQLHDGTYFGFRNHMRLYASPEPSEPWVAVQVHSEHFDWFTLRHAVDGVQDAQVRVEADLMDQPYVERLWRAHLDNAGASDSDGWATMVELSLLVPVVGLLASRAPPTPSASTPEIAREGISRVRARITPRHGLLVAVIAGILLGVRLLGTGLEQLADDLSVFVIAGSLYPVLALGLPVATFLVARGLEQRMDAGLTAAGALGGAMLVDYAYVGIDVLPLELVVHRTLLVASIGLIAAGAARRAARQHRFNTTLAVGAGMWIAMLVATLAGWI